MAEQQIPIASGIDHVILAVQDLDLAAACFQDQVGLAVGGGGTHPRAGTANRIAVLGDAYLELISAAPGAVPRGFIGARLDGREGWVGFALQTQDIEAAAATLRARGILFEGPAPGELAADGFSRSWRTIHLADPALRPLPFLIQHNVTGQERQRLLAGAEGPRPHSLGAQRITAVTVAAHNLDRCVEAYALCFDLAAQPEREPDAMLEALTARLALPSGALVIVATPETAGKGPVARALDERGEGLFAVTLAVDDLPLAVRSLRGRGVGVRVEEPDDILLAAHLNHRQVCGARLSLVGI
jgi:catechol 2,3-dioxygenase-like lactoylglutathione lyase family enzyme